MPNASVGGLAGLVEIVYAHNGQTDLPDLADELSFDVDDLLPLVDAATMLGLLEVESAQAFLTDAGRDWYTADINASKELFARLAVERAPLVRTIVKALENSNDGTLRDDFFRRPAPPGVLRRRHREAARHRHRLGPLRRAVRLRRRHR
jgi:NitT/TauT family transport system ATP-binding protein